MEKTIEEVLVEDSLAVMFPSLFGTPEEMNRRLNTVYDEEFNVVDGKVVEDEENMSGSA